MSQDAFDAWIAGLESRHFAELTFPEVSRALRALSSTYVERRQKLSEGAALAGAGKRAAFALFYAPLHYLLVEHIVGAPRRRSAHGANAASISDAELARRARPGRAPSPQRLASWRSIATRGRLVRRPRRIAHLASPPRFAAATSRPRRLPDGPAAILAAFTMNELTDASRDELMRRLIERAGRGDRVLVVEPLAGGAAPWWRRWQQAFELAGGRADEWRVHAELPRDCTEARSGRRAQSSRNHGAVAVAGRVNFPHP